ncbi:MAG TPA: hypothetical protein VI584_02910 [Nitrospiria bacterium]|nr:hypothetical protein [Nitrospiria bacterium]
MKLNIKRKRGFEPRFLTKREGIAVAAIGILFAVAGAWAFWLIHPLLSIALTAFLIWMAIIYHSKVCVICPHTNCPFNPRYWKAREDEK